ncbi:ethanolamine kinase 1-like [Lineus longissimus]|uniref:ethanolamine kinase 1-like n=1 Tax=Lineus longissimus TaxID=88925 RepID=UPI00315CF391
MAAEGDVPKLAITINPEDPDDDVMAIIEKLRPRWKRSDVKRKTLGENASMVNKMYAYYVTKTCDVDAIVVRIYGTDFVEYSDRDREIKVTLLLSEIGLSPKVYCTFENGMCFAFAKGKPYDLKDRATFSCKKLAMAVAKELAGIHCKNTAKLAAEKYGIPVEVDTAHESFRVALGAWGPEMDKLDPLVTTPEFPTKAMVKEEIDRVDQIVRDLGMPVVMSHNDLHPANVIFDQETGKCVIVDYEYSFFNHQGWDLAQYLFYAAFGVGVEKNTPEMHQTEYRKDFLRSYLKRLSILDNWGRDVTELDVDELLEKVNKFTMFVMLFHIPISLIVASKPPENFADDTNWCRGALNAWKLYLATRKELLGF